MASISTGTGDGGESGLLGGTRVPKDDPRLEASGTLDELNAAIGMARATGALVPIDDELRRISEWIFSLGTDLATPSLDTEKARLGKSEVEELELWIHREEASLPPLRRFILPGGTPTAAALHLARTICRRAERRVVSLSRSTGDGRVAIVFLNRLSDLFFLYARRANLEAGVPDVEWGGGE